MRLPLRCIVTAILTGSVFPATAATVAQHPLARAVQEHEGREALRLAREMLQASPEDAQAQFWLSFVAPHSHEGMNAWGLLRSRDAGSAWVLLGKAFRNPLTGTSLVDQAMAKAPGDASVLQAATLTVMALEQESSDLQPLVTFLANNKTGFENNADLLVTEAYANEFLSNNPLAPNAKKDMLAEVDRALELDPHNEAAELFKGRQSRTLGNAGLYAFLRKTAPNFPDSYPVQAELWTAGLAQDDVRETEPAVRTGIIAMMQRNQPTISQLRLTYQASVSHPETAAAFEDALLAKYPATGIADEVLFRRGDRDLPQGTPEQNSAARIAGLEAFLKRPNHPDLQVVKFAYERLEFLLASQDSPDLPMLYAAVAKQDGISHGIRLLARKKYRLPDLERIAVANFNQPWGMLDRYSQANRDVTSFVDFVLNDYVHFAETSLGLVYFEEGKLDQAQAVLDQAIEFHAMDAETTTVLAQVYQARGDFAKAQSLMLDALNQPHFGIPKNPALAAIPELYKAQHRTTVGLNDFMKPLLAKAREESRVAIVADRERSPKPVPAFTFVDTKGITVSSDAYKGKILIVNFWATWCGPCRAEFPQFQKLYEKYKDDPRVALLAVATDETATPTSTITSYIDKNKFTFPVVRSGEYSTENHINTIPLTWWIDPAGIVVYKKVGTTEDLVEEFTWRIEAIEEAAAKPQSSGSGQ